MKFSFKLVTFSKSYSRKQKWMFFPEYSVNSTMKTKDIEAIQRQRAKPSKIKAHYSRLTCKNCS